MQDPINVQTLKSSGRAMAVLDYGAILRNFAAMTASIMTTIHMLTIVPAGNAGHWSCA